MNWMNSLTPGFVVRAAISSPPISAAVSPVPPKVGKLNQSMVLPISSALFVWPVAMPPTKPPS